MKRFLLGFVVFLIYAAGCILFMELALPQLGIDGLLATSNETDLESFKNSFPDDSAAVSSDYLLDEKFDSVEATDSIAIQIDTLSSPTENGLSNNLPTTLPTTFNVILPDGVSLLSCNAVATIYKNSDRVKIPFPCRDYGLKIKGYLDTNPLAVVQITGARDISESTTIGKERAEYIKNLLVNIGVAEAKIITTSQLGQLDIVKGYAEGGLLMEIKANASSISINQPKPIKSEATTNISNATTIASKKFSSGFQGSYFYGDQKFTSYVNDLKRLINQNPGAKIYAYSFTDIVGDEKENFAISRDNASTVRKILVQAGIPSTKIQAVARGEQNSGTAGSNRCIIITVK